MNEDGGSYENVAQRKRSSRNTSVGGYASAGSSYPVIRQRGFYSEILQPESERRLGVSNSDI